MAALNTAKSMPCGSTWKPPLRYSLLNNWSRAPGWKWKPDPWGFSQVQGSLHHKAWFYDARWICSFRVSWEINYIRLHNYDPCAAILFSVGGFTTKRDSWYLLFHPTSVTSIFLLEAPGTSDFEGLPASSAGKSLAQAAPFCTNPSKANLATGWE